MTKFQTPLMLGTPPSWARPTPSLSTPRVEKKRRSGFTLLEVVLTLAVLVVVVAVVWPTLNPLQAQGDLAAMSDEMRGLLVNLRAKAMEEGRTYQLSYSIGGDSYTVSASGLTDDDLLSLSTRQGMESVDDEDRYASEEERKRQSLKERQDVMVGRQELLGTHQLPPGWVFTDSQGGTTERSGGTSADTAPSMGNVLSQAASDTQDTSGLLIEFLPDGSTTDTQLVLMDDNGDGLRFILRGMVGSLRVDEVTQDDLTGAGEDRGSRYQTVRQASSGSSK